MDGSDIYVGTTGAGVWKTSLALSVPGLTSNKKDDINIYPNPSSGEFTLDLKELNGGKLIITDVLGKEIMAQELKNGTKQIELSINTKGLYFVRLESGNKTVVKKIVVE
jgi:hypothetical protein